MYQINRFLGFGKNPPLKKNICGYVEIGCLHVPFSEKKQKFHLKVKLIQLFLDTAPQHYRLPREVFRMEHFLIICLSLQFPVSRRVMKGKQNRKLNYRTVNPASCSWFVDFDKMLSIIIMAIIQTSFLVST